jgi:DNA-binding MarR family transcriptional regulator
MDPFDIIIKIRKIVRSLNLESKSIQREFGLSITQLMCLGHLQHAVNYQSTHKELMDLLSLNSSTITGIINRLEKRGYIARMRKTGDKRLTFITLTASGLKLLEETPNILHDRLSSQLQVLSKSDKLMVNQALEIIISAMQISKIEASAVLTGEDPID